MERGPREVVPPLFLEVCRTQLSKAWSNAVWLRPEAPWAEGWAGDLPWSPPNCPMALWVRLGAICHRLLSKLKTAFVTLQITHIQLKPIWIKRFDRMKFLHRQVIEDLQRSLYLLLVSGTFLWDIYGRQGQHEGWKSQTTTLIQYSHSHRTSCWGCCLWFFDSFTLLRLEKVTLILQS